MKQKRILSIIALIFVFTALLGIPSFAAESNAPASSLNFVVVNNLNDLKDADLSKYTSAYAGGIPSTPELIKRGDNTLFQITANGDGTLITQVFDLFNIGHVKTLNGGNDPWGLGFYIETADAEVMFLQTYISETYGNALNKNAFLFDVDGYLVDFLEPVDSMTPLFIPENFKGYVLFEMADSCDYSSPNAEGFKQAVWWMANMLEEDSFIIDNFGYVTAEPAMDERPAASPSVAPSSVPTTAAPAPSDSPAASEAPVASPEAPATSEVPATSEAPAASEAPVASPEAPATSDVPVASPEAPATSDVPEASSDPTASEPGDSTLLIIAIAAVVVIAAAVTIFLLIKKGKKTEENKSEE